MTDVSSQRETQSKAFDRAWDLVQERWIPPNPVVLESIVEGIEKDRYRDNVDLLIEDLSRDLALFTFCLRELVVVLHERGRPLPPPTDPIRFFRWAGVGALVELVRRAEERFADSSFQDMTPAQAGRLQEALISATAAETLAPEARLRPEMGYSTALLRQFGLALVAWNYPHIYEHALKRLRNTSPGGAVSLERIVARRLGFVPSVLAMAMAREWHLAPELRAALGDPRALDEVSEERSATIRRVAENLQTICEVGEALARANDPDTYPTARSDWNTARREI
ncbi:MAG: HDOD domain-containing protein, partial [Bdellovibrionales bacterium]|nr:HDOD domain-containing protein [Bdellovibrionales bacterium]